MKHYIQSLILLTIILFAAGSVARMSVVVVGGGSVYTDVVPVESASMDEFREKHGW